jgi:hypothetical protein
MLKADEQISMIDREISKLLIQRSKLHMLKQVYSKGQMLSDMLNKASTFCDTEQALSYTKQHIIPMRDHLLPSHFPNAINAMLEPLPKRWTRVQASDFLFEVSRALGKDRVAML